MWSKCPLKLAAAAMVAAAVSNRLQPSLASAAEAQCLANRN